MAEREVIKTIWLAAEQTCGKRLKEAMGLWLPHYEKEHGEDWTHVRQLVGYGRLEGERAAELLNDLYARERGWFRNFFPPMKHLRTEVAGSRKKRIYDKPATPFERLKDCHQIDPARLAVLQSHLDSLNPFALKRTIERKLRAVLHLQVRRAARWAA